MENERRPGTKRETPGNRHKNGAPARQGLAALLLLVIAGGAAVFLGSRLIPSGKHVSPEAYFGIRDGETAVVINGTPSAENGRPEGEKLYLSYEDASSVNPSVFYDEEDELLIVTTPDQKMTVPVSEGSSGSGEYILADEGLFVSFDYLSEVSDMAVSRFEEPDRLVITTDFEQKAAAVTKKIPVRKSPGIRNPILTDLAEGTEVWLHEDSDGVPEKKEGWAYVTTDDGYTGYVEEKYLSDASERTIAHESPVGEYTKHHSDEPVNMVFHQTTSQAANAALTEAAADVTGVNVIAPTWFFLDNEEGAVSSLESRDYVETAHALGYKVWPVLNDFDGGIASSSSTAAALSSDSSRTAIIDRVMEGLAESGADGLVIDIELVRADSASDFLELVREFSVRLRTAGLTFSICNYVPAFTSYYNRAEQARVADYLVVMCYDEHEAGSAKAGSVASLPFVRKGIEGTVAEAGAENVIAAIPFYTRLWITEGDTVRSEVQGMRGAENCVESLGLSEKWDANAGQYYAEATEGNTKWQIWREETDSIREKMNLIAAAGCAGVAEWKLGLEKPEIWPVISEGLA